MLLLFCERGTRERKEKEKYFVFWFQKSESIPFGKNQKTFFPALSLSLWEKDRAGKIVLWRERKGGKRPLLLRFFTPVQKQSIFSPALSSFFSFFKGARQRKCIKPGGKQSSISFPQIAFGRREKMLCFWARVI